MRVTLNREKFISVLSSAKGFTINKETEPTLSCVKLTVIGDAVEVIATNLECSFKKTYEGINATENGVVLINCEKALAILKESSVDDFDLYQEGNFVVLNIDGGTFKLNSFNVSEFPEVNLENDALSITMLSKRIDEIIREVSFCSAKEFSRYSLNGVLLSRKGDRVHFTSTDGKRLAWTSEKFIGPIQEKELKSIVPVSGLQLLKSIQDKSENVLISFFERSIQFVYDNATVSIQTLEGRFPKWEDIIPKSSPYQVQCTTKELLSKLKQASLFAPEKNPLIVLTIKENRLEASAQTSSKGEALVSSSCTFSGDELKIGVNYNYLLDVLKAWNNEEVVLKFKDDTSCIVIENGDLLYLIMPCDVKG